MPRLNLPKVCVYCGTTEGITRDHVPQRCLFTTPPSNPITVPSCKACNHGASKDDEYFRWAISFRQDVADHPEVDEVAETAARSLERSQAKGFRRLVIGSQGWRNAATLTPGGVSIELARGYEVDLRRLNRVARRVMLGLFAHEFGGRLPAMYDAITYAERQLQDLDEAVRNELLLDCEAIQAKPPTIVGEQVLSYWFGRSEMDPNHSLWALVFYQQVRFIGMTFSKGQAS